MSERYSRLFALSENQYASGSPVVIAAGALLKDNQTGKVIAQLKLRNISSKPIKAATVCIVPFDTVGNPIGDSVSYQYLDLSAKRDEDFGQKAAITLPNATTRSFAATVEEIAFVDNTIWKATGEPWEVLPVPSSIGRIHGAEFEKQFRLKYGADCKNLPLSEKDLWYCACGALNRKEEQVCHACGKSHAVLASIDYDAIRSEMEIRVAAEKEQAEKAAAAAREREAAARAKAKKVGKIAAIVAPVLVVIVVAAVMISGMVKKSNAYNDALALMDAEQYEEAITAFAALDGYKDSAEQIRLAENAIAEMKRAAELEANYNNAIQLLESNVSANENEAYNILMGLGDYKNAKELLADFQYVLISEISEVIDMREPFETVYEYDEKGLLISKKEADGDVYTYEYDNEGRMISEVLNEGTTRKVYWYLKNGTIQKSLTESSKGTITTDFDIHGSPIKVVNTYQGITWEFNYIYSDNDNVDVIECYYTKKNEVFTNIFSLSEIDGNLKINYDILAGVPVFKSIGSDGKEIEYIISYDYWNGIQLKKNVIREYDSYGNPIKETQVDGGKDAGCSHSNNYDANGKLIQMTTSYLSGMKIQNDYIYGYIYTPDAV